MPSAPVVHWTRYFTTAALASLAMPVGLPLVRALERGEPLSWPTVGKDLAAAPLTYAWAVLATLAISLALAALFARWNERARFMMNN